jgi:hypothetical protein
MRHDICHEGFILKEFYMRSGETKWRGVLIKAVVAGTFCALPAISMADSAANPSSNDQQTMPNQQTGQQTGNQQSAVLELPAGFQKTTMNSDGEIESELVKLTDRAFSTGSYGEVLNELAASDKERATHFKDVDQSNLDKSIDQIKSAWKTKYGQDLNVNDTNLKFNDQIQIVQGEVDQPAIASLHWPVAACEGQGMASTDQKGGTSGNQPDNTANAAGSNNNNNDQARTASERTGAEAENTVQGNGADLTKGRDIALVRLQAGHGRPDITVSMVHEPIGGWTISIPQSRSGEQVYNDFSSQLSYIGAHVDQWPGDQGEAYRMLTHHVVSALYGVRAGTMSGANSQ